MTRDELNERYFEWMYQLVCNEKYSKRLSFKKLLRYLHERAFVYTISMDGNRAEDGIDLRYRFGYEQRYDNSMIASLIDDKECSVLEMMIALSIRCEEHIMEDADIGNRTGQWFWNMVVSLGLGSMNDARFDKQFVENTIDRFLNHQYERDGRGGLFTVEYGRNDMRTAEIWYQMCWYLDTIL